MKRFTFESGDGYHAVNSENCYEDQNEDYCGSAIDRLGAYEDTGFTPEEIVQMAEELRKLKENTRVVPVIRMREET